MQNLVAESKHLIYELNEIEVNGLDYSRDLLSENQLSQDESKSLTMWKMRNSAGTSMDHAQDLHNFR